MAPLKLSLQTGELGICREHFPIRPVPSGGSSAIQMDTGIPAWL